jgi:hypothetical protein
MVRLPIKSFAYVALATSIRVRDIIFHKSIGPSCFHLNECIDEQLFSIEDVTKRASQMRQPYNIFPLIVFYEITLFVKYALLFVSLSFGSLQYVLLPFWLLVGRSFFFLHWDGSHKSSPLCQRDTVVTFDSLARGPLDSWLPFSLTRVKQMMVATGD